MGLPRDFLGVHFIEVDLAAAACRGRSRIDPVHITYKAKPLPVWRQGFSAAELLDRTLVISTVPANEYDTVGGFIESGLCGRSLGHALHYVSGNSHASASLGYVRGRVCGKGRIHARMEASRALRAGCIRPHPNGDQPASSPLLYDIQCRSLDVWTAILGLRRDGIRAGCVALEVVRDRGSSGERQGSKEAGAGDGACDAAADSRKFGLADPSVHGCAAQRSP